MADDQIPTTEDILIEVLQGAFPDVRNIETRPGPQGDIIKDLEGRIGSAPFILIEHNSGDSVRKDEAGRTIIVQNIFNLFVAAKSFRDKKDAQRGSYSMIEGIRRVLDGQMFAQSEDATKRTGKMAYVGHSIFADLVGGTVYLVVFTETASVK